MYIQITHRILPDVIITEKSYGQQLPVNTDAVNVCGYYHNFHYYNFDSTAFFE